MKKRESGITLVALVVTIIVLLILAAVSINLVIGENGIITRSKQAKMETQHAGISDAIALEYLDYEAGKEENITLSFEDFLKNKGFVDEDGNIKVAELTKNESSNLNGYKVEKSDNEYKLKYYDKDNQSKVIWQVDIQGGNELNWSNILLNTKKHIQTKKIVQ